MAKPTVKELRGKIAARKAEREAKKKQKFAKMRSAAEKAPEKMEKRLAGIAEKCASMTEAIENLRVNLGLHRSATGAPLKVRVAVARNYGKTFKRIAEEAPERLAEAVTEAYNGLNDIAADLEMAANELGINLENGMEQEMPMEQGMPEGIVEEAVMEGESPEHEMAEKLEGEGDDEEKEASGSDAWVTDRDESGQPKAPITANSGSDAFVTDRDKGAEPEKPAKMEVPQAQGKAAGESKVAMSRKDYILIADAIRSFRMPNQQREDLARHLSKYLRGDNYNFSEGIFVDYVLGRGGSHGGGKFKGEEPNVPDTLFT